MKIMMSAGEASGDLHGGALAAELKKLRPDIELFGMGGSDMQRAAYGSFMTLTIWES